MVGHLRKLFEEIDQSEKYQTIKGAYEHIYTSVIEKYLCHIQFVRRLHTTKGKPPTGPERS
jgi:hypothetical protein